MKKFYFLITSLFMLVMINMNAQVNLLKGGDMEKADEDKWTVSYLANDPTSVIEYTFGSTTSAPKAGKAGCLDVVFTNSGTNGTHIMFYQQVTLKKGKNYTFDLAAKAIQPMNNSWFECYIGPEPTEGADYAIANGSKLIGGFKWSGWEATCADIGDEFDATFMANACIASGSNVITYEGTGDTTLFIGFKMGIWGMATTVEIAIDNVSLSEIGGATSINQVKNNGIQIYPNPVANVISFKSQNRLINACIRNMMGQEVLNLKNIDNTINVAKLKTGLYMIELKDEFNHTTVQKFIKE